jgi:hypothetical protein
MHSTFIVNIARDIEDHAGVDYQLINSLFFLRKPQDRTVATDVYFKDRIAALHFRTRKNIISLLNNSYVLHKKAQSVYVDILYKKRH